MKIIKDNIVLSLFCITALFAFVILLIYKSGISEEIDNKKAEIQRAIRLQKEYVEELSIYTNLTNDFTRAQSELKQLATIEKQQKENMNIIFGEHALNKSYWVPIVLKDHLG